MTEQDTTAEGTKAAAPDHEHVRVGLKCDMCDMAMPMPVADFWSGGAKTFAEFDQYRAAADVEEAVESEMSVFYRLVDNVKAAPDLDARGRAQAIQTLAGELDTRLAAAAAEEIAEQAQGTREAAVTSDPGSMTAFKDTTGAWRWFAIHSNKYEDREREIFPEAAHKAFVEEATRTKRYPSLRLWHVPYDIGIADALDYTPEGFVVSTGTFLPGMEDIAERLAGAKGLGCSHGFNYNPKDYRDGVYHKYRSFEVTALPRERASNLLTAYFAGEEFPVGMTPAVKAFMTEMAGPERVAIIEAGLTAMKAVAEEKGIAYKDIEEGLLDARGVKEEPVEAPTAEATEEQAAAAAAAGAATAAATEAPADAAPDGAATPPEAPAEATGDEVETPSEEDVADAAKAFGGVDFMTGIKAAFESAIAPTASAVEDLRSIVAAQQVEIAGLKSARGEEIAAMIRPRVGPANGAPSSMDGGNLLSAEDAAKVKAAAEPPEGTAHPTSGYLQDMFEMASAQTGRAALDTAMRTN